jgi:hypothetical protein
MTIQVKGSFEVKMTPKPWNDSTEAHGFGRFLLDKQYHGDLEATGDGQMLSAGNGAPGSSGVYVAIEKITGSLQGRKGSFIVYHLGIMNARRAAAYIGVVPDSGTDELKGLAGTMNIQIADGKITSILYIGTGSGKIGYGGTMPFVTPPFGMTNWTPQTRQNKISVVSYKYEDTSISGFIGTHQPAIWMGDYGYVTLMPEIGELKTTPKTRKLSLHAQRRDCAARLLLGLDGCGRLEKNPHRDDSNRALRLHALHLSSQTDSRILVEASRPGIPGFAKWIAANKRSSATIPTAWTQGSAPSSCPTSKATSSSSFASPSQSGTATAQSDNKPRSNGAYASSHTTAGEVIERASAHRSSASIRHAPT